MRSAGNIDIVLVEIMISKQDFRPSLVNSIGDDVDLARRTRIVGYVQANFVRCVRAHCLRIELG